MSARLVVICPQSQTRGRLDALLAQLPDCADALRVETAQALQPQHGQRILFAVSVGETGVNLEYFAMLEKLRCDPGFLEGCLGAVIVDGSCELYTKSLARELVFAANRAGCAFIGKPLVEGTGSLRNFQVQARLRDLPLGQAYHACAAELVQRLLAYQHRRMPQPRILALHASNRSTSNTLRLWDMTKQSLQDHAQLQEIGLRNGEVTDCRGCSYQACLHLGEQGSCFYGGVIVDEVYPALCEADAVVWICPNYNDALAANLTACINRLTALLYTKPFYEKAMFGIVVSGYSGGDLVAEQLISALCMNKAFYLPPHFCALETANDAGSAEKLPGIGERMAAFAENILAQIQA